MDATTSCVVMVVALAIAGLAMLVMYIWFRDAQNRLFCMILWWLTIAMLLIATGACVTWFINSPVERLSDD